jgi:electron transport complex protein RnfC
MIKRSFFGITAPRLSYEVLEEAPGEPMAVMPAKRITLLIDDPLKKAGSLLVKPGDTVLAGQRLQLFENDPKHFAIVPLAGKVFSVEPFIGMMEKQMTAVLIDVDKSGEQARDTSFSEMLKSAGIAQGAEFFKGLPGGPDFTVFSDSGKNIKTIAILGTESDLLGVTSQHVIGTNIASVKSGIDVIRKITGNHHILLFVHEQMSQVAGASGAGIKIVDMQYPSGSKEMIHTVLKSEPGREGDIAFFTAEAVASLGEAVQSNELPLEKLVTVVKKDGSRQVVKAPLGTHISDILEAVRQGVEAMDKVIIGGPMTGNAAYSLDQPIVQDTDILMVQDSSDITEIADTPCTNCGACVRVCPVNVPVNILVRYLDAGQYEPASEEADLFSCIECGLCTYVCESRIPILQFIALAKQAVQRLKAAEEENA